MPALVVDEGDRILENEEQEQNTTGNIQSPQDSNNMDIDYSSVKLVVIDGIVMGPNVCILTITVARKSNAQLRSWQQLNRLP